jgi:hypothetical protein
LWLDEIPVYYEKMPNGIASIILQECIITSNFNQFLVYSKRGTEWRLLTIIELPDNQKIYEIVEKLILESQK